MGAHSRPGDSSPRQGTESEGQAWDKRRLHHYTSRKGEIHNGRSRENYMPGVEGRVHFRAAPRGAGAEGTQCLSSGEQRPGPDADAPGFDRTRCVSWANGYPVG